MKKMIFKIRRFSTHNRKDSWLPLPPLFTTLLSDEDICTYIIEENSNYKKEYKEHISKTKGDFIYRKRLKELRKELKGGNIYFDLNKNSNTHCLEVTKKFHYMSKDIDGHNRLTYYIYPPQKIAEKEYVITIVLDHCTHHRDRVTSKLYSE